MKQYDFIYKICTREDKNVPEEQLSGFLKGLWVAVHKPKPRHPSPKIDGRIAISGRDVVGMGWTTREFKDFLEWLEENECLTYGIGEYDLTLGGDIYFFIDPFRGKQHTHDWYVEKITDPIERRREVIKVSERADVLSKTDGHCYLCSTDLIAGGESGKAWHSDHVFPISKGGTCEAANRMPACQSCNSKKHDQTLVDFIGSISDKPAQAPKIKKTFHPYLKDGEQAVRSSKGAWGGF